MSEVVTRQSASSHPAFNFVSTTHVESLNIDIQQYEHKVTGAVHYHIASDHDEKVFLVAVRTMPHDSTGVAHILEHTALCGSEKYPVRDPFFMMTRRSLNTFMNAMTSSDWTAYPFASQNDKDFDNLLDVYLDAVFFSRLHPLDFAQEGHRVEFEDDSESSKLVYKGVVFNEMKGAMSSPVSQLWQGISAYLFPTTTYHYNSGGEPADITDLTYEQLLAFYREHYHPSNAIFMTFGNLDVNELHSKLDSQALSRFERQEKQWKVAPEKRYSAPMAVEACYGVDGEDLAAKTHHVVGWLLGESTNLDEQLEAHLVSSVLLDNSASPLRKALEQTELGGSPSPLCGLEDSNREMSFLCGVEGSEPEHAQAVEQLILATLTRVSEEGVEHSVVEAALHQLELHQREIGGDHYPYGMQLIFNALPAATHHGDPVALINLDPALQRLREKAASPSFMQDAIKRLLLNNRHRVRYTLKPDGQVNEEAKRLESDRLEAIRDSLSPEQALAIRKQTEALKERQAEVDDDSILPQVTLEDVKPELSFTPADGYHAHPIPTTEYTVGTNGILYQQLMIDLPTLSREQLSLLPVFTHSWTEIGAGGQDYLAQQQKQTSIVGSLSAYSAIKSQVADANAMDGYLVMTGKALANQADAFSDLMRETWVDGDFSDQKRLLDLLTQMRARKENSITGSGHSYAMSLASAPLNDFADLSNDLSGLPHIQRLKNWSEQAKQDGGQTLSEALSAIYAQVGTTPDSILLVHDEASASAHQTSVVNTWADITTVTDNNDIKWNAAEHANYWMVDSQVNFCAWALPTVPMTHVDAAPLAVLGGVLRNGFLHTAVREQGGAYGAGATQDSSMSCFKFYSYRDPRVEGTFEDYRKSIDWVLNLKDGEHLVEQSILGLIGSLDRPGSPAGEAKQCFHMDKSGRTFAIRQTFRERLLATTWADLQRVAEHYLRDNTGSMAVIAPRGTDAIAEKLGLKVCEF